MKRLISISILVSCLLAVAPGARAQDCSHWTNADLRGTYTFSGDGWIDLSKILPGMPAAMVPMSWVGAKSLDGMGHGTGWVSFNAGGIQLRMLLTGLSYAMQADCSLEMSYTLATRDLGVTLGPVARLFVIMGSPDALELHGIFMGTGMGTQVDRWIARRISMQSW